MSTNAYAEILRDTFAHNAWATARLIDYCAELTPDQLQATAPGTVGSLQDTLKHILGAESYYSSLFSGETPNWDWQEDEPATIEQLRRWSADMRSFWQDLLDGPLDPETQLQQRHGWIKPGAMLTQALHHANIHREQACSIITSMGLQPPDLSGWAFARDTGRSHRW